MNVSTVAKRYALALFQIAKEKQLLEQMEEELRVVKEVVSQNKDFSNVLKSPKLSIQKKIEFVKQVFSALNPNVQSMIMLLVERHRQDLIIEIAEQFITLANDEKGVAAATVTSIRPLTDEESKALSATFAAKVGKQSLEITNLIDSDLLGGVKVRIGNRIFDGSLRGKLERLERQLLR
jgi:F-type H+-transporting ATPase subunit delta